MKSGSSKRDKTKNVSTVKSSDLYPCFWDQYLEKVIINAAIIGLVRLHANATFMLPFISCVELLVGETGAEFYDSATNPTDTSIMRKPTTYFVLSFSPNK